MEICLCPLRCSRKGRFGSRFSCEINSSELLCIEFQWVSEQFRFVKAALLGDFSASVFVESTSNALPSCMQELAAGFTQKCTSETEFWTAKKQNSARLCSIRKDNLMQNILFPLLFSTSFSTAVSLCVGSCMAEYFESRLCEDILIDMLIFGLLNIGLAFFATWILNFLQPVPRCSVLHQLSTPNLVLVIFFCEGAALKFVQLFRNSSHNREVRWRCLNNHCYISSHAD